MVKKFALWLIEKLLNYCEGTTEGGWRQMNADVLCAVFVEPARDEHGKPEVVIVPPLVWNTDQFLKALEGSGLPEMIKSLTYPIDRRGVS